MSKSTTDVMIHMKSSLSPEQFDEVASQIKSIEGVVRFDQSSRKPNFIMVAYHATQTKSLVILNKLTRLGFNASLVGI
ncbi:MAG: hypothetical protein OEW89_04515 [Gammaproteobacteria bacterium]|nr:hypothetical protein [Gammaproteobacteria bacterium]MDH5593360.1 hypothetical protein [Gammaproteobacteria bacterium]MDH5614845.1 hypothetical protein [Gammaproteobacteria bacterium]